MICWFSFVWRHFDLVKQVKFGVSGHFPENAWREWPPILHADVSRLPSELISLWSRSVDFSNFGIIWLSETGQIWGFRAFSRERTEGMAWNFARWCILTTFRTDKIMVTVCWFYFVSRHLDLVKQVQFGVSGHFSGESMEGIAWNFARWCISTTSPAKLIKSPRYTGGDFMFLYRFIRRRRRRRRRSRRRPQILVHAITFERLFGFLSFLARLLPLTCRLPD